MGMDIHIIILRSHINLDSDLPQKEKITLTDHHFKKEIFHHFCHLQDQDVITLLLAPMRPKDTLIIIVPVISITMDPIPMNMVPMDTVLMDMGPINMIPMGTVLMGTVLIGTVLMDMDPMDMVLMETVLMDMDPMDMGLMAMGLMDMGLMAMFPGAMISMTMDPVILLPLAKVPQITITVAMAHHIGTQEKEAQVKDTFLSIRDKLDPLFDSLH